MNARAISLLGILVVGAPVALSGQGRLSSIPQRLSLEEALDLAETYSPVYLQTANDRGPAAWGVRNAYASFVPTLNVSSSATYQGAGVQRFLIRWWPRAGGSTATRCFSPASRRRR